MPVNVFISGTSAEYGSLRLALRDLLSSMSYLDIHPVIQENLEAYPGIPTISRIEFYSKVEQAVKKALSTIQDKGPSVFRQMIDLLGKGAITGTAGRLLYDWLMHLSTALR